MRTTCTDMDGVNAGRKRIKHKSEVLRSVGGICMDTPFLADISLFAWLIMESNRYGVFTSHYKNWNYWADYG